MTLGLMGDCFCRQMASTGSIKWGFLAASVWALTAIPWVVIFKNYTFIDVAANYSSLNLIIFSLIGIFLYHDPVTLKTAIAIGLSILAIYLAG